MLMISKCQDEALGHGSMEKAATLHILFNKTYQLNCNANKFNLGMFNINYSIKFCHPIL